MYDPRTERLKSVPWFTLLQTFHEGKSVAQELVDFVDANEVGAMQSRYKQASAALSRMLAKHGASLHMLAVARAQAREKQKRGSSK